MKETQRIRRIEADQRPLVSGELSQLELGHLVEVMCGYYITN